MADTAEQLFYAARERSAGDARTAFLEAACGEDAALREQVERLLKADAEAGRFLTGEPPPRNYEAVESNTPSSGRALGPGAALAASSQIGDVVGRYKLVEQIGEGGFGTVYLAEQREPVTRRVALKVIKLGMDTRQVIARFDAERQALAMMDHPSIARVLDAGSTDTGRPYFVMEYIDGVPMLEYCDTERLDTKQRLELFKKICLAIQHAHQKGIIHRDIKPSNVLVTMHDDVPVPKVIDFGIAKATRAELAARTLFTEDRHMIGAPAYMSPEQAEMSGRDIDTRSDIYSLGVLLYELLTGTTPFDSKELTSKGFSGMIRIIREVEPHKPSTRLSNLGKSAARTALAPRALDAKRLSRSLRGDLDWIVMRCLEKDRTRRYVTANELAMDIQRYLSGEPVFAAPPSAAYRVTKFIHRNRGMVTAASAVAASLLIGAIAFAWQAKIALQQRDRAEQQLVRAEWLVYAGKLMLAQSDFEAGNGGLALHYLRECQPSFRGWEWRYLWERINAQLTLEGHRREVTSAAFSPDGLRIVTSSEDGTAKVWETATGKELFTLTGHRGHVLDAAFSHDGRRIVTAGGLWSLGKDGGDVRIWDAMDGSPLLALAGHEYCAWSAAFSPDDRRIVSSAGDWGHLAAEVKLWDASTGQELLALDGLSATVRSVAFGPDGRRILTGSQDGTTRVWDSATGQKVLTLEAPGVEARAVAFSPDGRRIVVGDGKTVNEAKVWDAATGRGLLDLNGHAARVESVAYSRDGRRIATGSSDQTVKTWDAATGHVVLTLKGHAGVIRSVEFSPDGRRVLSASNDRTARVWDAQKGQELPILRGHGDSVSSIAFSPDSTRIVTGSTDGTAKIWDAVSAREIATLGEITPIWTEAGLWSVAVSPDGRRIVTGGQDRTATVWDVATRQRVFSMTHTEVLTSVAFSPDGRWIASGQGDWAVRAERPGEVKLWDSVTGGELLTIKLRDAVSGVAFSPDGGRIAASCRDRTATVWDVATGRELLAMSGHTGGLLCVAYSADGTRIVTGSLDMTARVWDAATGRALLTLSGHTGAVRAAVFSPDGTRIVTGSEDRSAKVWDAGKGAELFSMGGHATVVLSVAFSPDGQRVVTGIGGADAIAKVWSAAPIPRGQFERGPDRIPDSPN